jgi:hypothetical protein
VTTEEQRQNNIKLYVVADNASNIQAALNRLSLIKSVSCFAHTAQLVVNGAVKNCADIHTTVAKAKSITTFFKHNVQSTRRLLQMEKQMGIPQLKPKQECPTRWNSMFDMIERLLSIKHAVSAVIASSKKVETLTANEWELAEALVAILKPFKVATAALSAFRYPSISMVIPTLNQLKYQLQLDNPASTCLQILKEELFNNIDMRWPSYEFNVTYSVATMIDPRYKDCGFEDQQAVAEARRNVLKEMDVYSYVTQLPTSSNISQSTSIDSQDNGGM